MFSNYLKIAWRNITGNPLFSAINIIGLAIGLACCIIITVFVRYEVSYDKHWRDADRIYRVTRDFYSNDLELAAVAPPIAPLLQQDFPEIEIITRIMVPGGITLLRGEQTYLEELFVIADSNVFEQFDFKFVAGDPKTALANPTSLVIAAARADRTSFGCDDKREWTHFGDAYFNRALRQETSFRKAFERARRLVARWETKGRLVPSLPQIMGGEALMTE
mgnify:CR=1 FL=1